MTFNISDSTNPFWQTLIFTFVLCNLATSAKCGDVTITYSYPEQLQGELDCYLYSPDSRMLFESPITSVKRKGSKGLILVSHKFPNVPKGEFKVAVERSTGMLGYESDIIAGTVVRDWDETITVQMPIVATYTTLTVNGDIDLDSDGGTFLRVQAITNEKIAPICRQTSQIPSDVVTSRISDRAKRLDRGVTFVSILPGNYVATLVVRWKSGKRAYYQKHFSITNNAILRMLGEDGALNVDLKESLERSTSLTFGADDRVKVATQDSNLECASRGFEIDRNTKIVHVVPPDIIEGKEESRQPDKDLNQAEE